MTAVESPVSTHIKRVLTGYRPTGPLHVGHWAGNIENMLRVQDDAAYDCFYFIADWHMLTTHYDRTDELTAWTRGLVLDWLAAGIDPEKAVVYRQSDLPEVAEMTLLASHDQLAWDGSSVSRSFKERLWILTRRNGGELGLLGYPIL